MQMPLAFLVGVPGGGELLLIFVAVLLMFGPKKLPEIARQIGKAMEYLRQTSQEFRDQVMRLDEEATKTVEAAVNDKPEESGQNELPLGVNDPSSPEDPYQTAEYYNGSDSSTSTTPIPADNKKSLEKNEIKLEDNNAAKVDSNVAVIPESIPGSEVKDAGEGNGLTD